VWVTKIYGEWRSFFFQESFKINTFSKWRHNQQNFNNLRTLSLQTLTVKNVLSLALIFSGNFQISKFQNWLAKIQAEQLSRRFFVNGGSNNVRMN
jgi:hypothetical protein